MHKMKRRHIVSKKKKRRNMEAGEMTVADQTEGVGESSAAAMAERERGMEVVRGYRSDRPPEDDCCPICHDGFHIPCRTSCGHWFCAKCILHLWRYMAKFKQCTCPLCGSLIFNFVPQPSALIQPAGEEVSEVLKEIHRYNTQNMVGWFGLLRKAVTPRFTWTRLNNILQVMRIITLLLRVDRLFYQIYGYDLFILGGFGMRMLICMCTFALLIYVIWKRWKRLRRVRQMADRNVIVG